MALQMSCFVYVPDVDSLNVPFTRASTLAKCWFRSLKSRFTFVDFSRIEMSFKRWLRCALSPSFRSSYRCCTSSVRDNSFVCHHCLFKLACRRVLLAASALLLANDVVVSAERPNMLLSPDSNQLLGGRDGGGGGRVATGAATGGGGRAGAVGGGGGRAAAGALAGPSGARDFNDFN